MSDWRHQTMEEKPSSGMKRLYQSLTSSLEPAGGRKNGFSWNQLPQLLNLLRRMLLPDAFAEKLDCDPIFLHVSPAEVYRPETVTPPIESASPCQSGALVESVSYRQVAHPLEPTTLGLQVQPPLKASLQLLSLDNFKFLMEQVPAIRSIEFSGKYYDPLHNPDLAAMINFAYRYNHAESRVLTDGLLLGPTLEALFKSHLQLLSIRLYAHRPSLYSRMSGDTLQNFVPRLEQVKRALACKQVLKSTVEIELRMMVDIDHYRLIPEMIAFADALGVNSLRIENYVTSASRAIPSEQSIFQHHRQAVAYLAHLESTLCKNSALQVILPMPFAQDMSTHRYCVEPYALVSTDADFNVFGCSQQVPSPYPTSKIWEPEFFNHPTYQWLRSIHGSSAARHSTVPIPDACRLCPRNMPR